MPSQPANPKHPRPPVAIPDHELLRRIGRGSYGEVWLARSVTGAYRAVKIVWRDDRDRARPRDREFDGIKRYEQISRGHEGLVDVLHVGRAPLEECFYYVMELADDIETNSALLPSSDPESYRQKTLRDLQKRAGRLPVSQCLEISARLASALSQLHGSGLVHRDIKPSNVIFVNDQPKLADLGLVASLSEACSFVGTEGFVAPEGPGTVQADIYSFGKLLYEMVTGLDRLEFPKLPARATAPPEEVEEFAELNEILLRACDKDPGCRYASAEELRRELLFLQGGRSVRKVRLIERRAALARKVSLIAAAAALTAIISYFGSFRQFQRAQEAERKAVATVQSLQLQQAEEHFRRDDSSTALAILAHLVRQDPANRIAVERLLAALTWRNFALPRIEPLLTEGRPRMSQFNKDNTEVMTGTYDGVIETWDAATGLRKASTKFSDGRIYGLEYSPDGKLAAIAGQGYAAIVDASTLEPAVPVIRPATNRIMAAHFSPDQKWLLNVGPGLVCNLWEVATGRQMGPDWRHDASVRVAAFSPDGKRAITGTRSGEIKIWEVPSGKLIAPPLNLHTAIVWKITFSPDGKLAASASDDHEARLWDASTGALHAVLRHKNCVADVDFSPDGTKVVTASEDLTAVIWDVATGQPIGQPLRHRNWVRQARFSPDGQRVVTASEDNTTRIWDAETTEPIVEPMRHPTEVVQASFSHSGKTLVATVSSTTATTGEEVWLWNVAAQGARGLPLLTDDQATTARFSPDGRQLAVACKSGAVRLWPRANYHGKEEVLSHEREVQHIAFSEDGQWLASVQDREAMVWDLKTRTPIGAPMTHSEQINAIQFHADGRKLLTASADGTACIWETATGRCLRMFPPAHLQTSPMSQADIFTASFSPDCTMVVTASRNERATVWNAETGDKMIEFPHDHWVTSAEFSPDGRSVLTASIDRSAIIWDIATGQPAGPPLTHDSDIRTAHFSGDGSKVITTSMDWTARIWDAKTGTPLSEMLRHKGPARVAAFSPTSNHALTGADDGTVRLWDATTGISLNDGFQHTSGIDSAAFSPDGELVLVVPKKGDATVYELLSPVFPAPKWLPDLAESVAGQRLGENGKLERTSPRTFFDLRRRMNRPNLRGFYARWAAWFLQDAEKRTISPRSKVTVADYAQRKIEMNKVPDLRSALFLAPTNALAHGRLARLYAEDEGAPSSRLLRLADWHISYASELDPASQEIQSTRRGMETNRMKSQTVIRAQKK